MLVLLPFSNFDITIAAEQRDGLFRGGILEEDIDVPDGTAEERVTHSAAGDVHRTWNCLLKRFQNVAVVLNLAGSVGSHCYFSYVEGAAFEERRRDCSASLCRSISTERALT
jgi:hypothetical protein